MNDFPISEIEKISLQDRLLIGETIWASIADQPDAVEMPDWHKNELQRRLAAHEKNPESGSVWADVKKRILG